jgi:TolB-like protein
MELMVLPFERKGKPGEVERIEERLLMVLMENGRFKMKKKIGKRIGKLDDTDAAAQAGKNMNVNYVLAGSLAEKKGSMEIYAQIIETNTSQILTIQNVYGVDIDRETLDKLCKGLVLKLHDALPVSEGIVLRATGKKVLLDLGKESRIKEGMRCILFKEGEPLVHPVTGKALGSPMVELGRAMILAVHEGYCEAEIQEVFGDEIAASHKVITK